MADIHILEGDRDEEGVVTKRYAFHFLIPVGEQVPEAAEDPILVAFESTVPDIDPTELADIKAAKIWEHVITLPYFHTESATSVLTRVRTRYAALETKVIERYKERYAFYLAEKTKA